MVLQTCREKLCCGLISLQLDSMIWETASPRTHKPKIVNELLSHKLWKSWKTSKIKKKVPCMEKSWNLKKNPLIMEKSLEFCEMI